MWKLGSMQAKTKSKVTDEPYFEHAGIQPRMPNSDQSINE